jgi:hypothetical protein
MVVNTNHSIAHLLGCARCYWRWLGSSTFYLYTFLNFISVENKDRYKTLLVIVIGLLIISLKYHVLFYVALGIGLSSLLSSFIAKWIEWVWFKIAHVLGWINTRIILSIIYFVFLLPIAWISRLFTKDPLMLKAKGAQSLYVTRDHLYKKEDLENIW